MKKISFLFLSLAFVLLAGTACHHKAKPDDTNAAPVPQKQLTKEEMESKWKDYATPVAEHRKLSPMVGKWKYVAKFWMDPSAPPEISKGKSEFKWTMGGRFLEHSASGTSMGKPFHGSGLVGYDKALKKYRTIWIDDMGTGMMIGTGKFDDKKKQLIEWGKSSCPMSGEIAYRGITTLIDKNNISHEMFAKFPGSEKETKVMEIQYSRK